MLQPWNAHRANPANQMDAAEGASEPFAEPLSDKCQCDGGFS